MTEHPSNTNSDRDFQSLFVDITGTQGVTSQQKEGPSKEFLDATSGTGEFHVQPAGDPLRDVIVEPDSE